MVVHRAGHNGVALVLGEDDLAESGLTWEQVDDSSARKWVLDAFAELGLPAHAPVQIEAFTGSGCMMLLARAEWPRSLYLFANLEDLLDCSRALGSSICGPCALYAFGGQYILAANGCNARLSEYAERLPDCYIKMLAEYGKQLIQFNALERLAEIFHA